MKFMIEDRLPISIQYSTELTVLLHDKFFSVLNKLEAQLNFQTMMANWYGDEHHIIEIILCLYEPNEYITLRDQNKKQLNFLSCSDDVFCIMPQENSIYLTCHIAITQTELALLTDQPKLDSPLLNKKLTKILSLLAIQLNLPQLSI